METIKNIRRFALLPLVVLLLVFGCSDDDLNQNIGQAGPLQLSVTDSVLVLNPGMYLNNFTFSWTTGTNENTGASISYKLELDLMGNDFANPVEYDFGKNKYSFDMNVATLNNILLTTFGGVPGESISLQARVIASFGIDSVENQTATVDLTFTPYKPLTGTLYMVGSATPAGWDIGNAVPMVQSASNPMEFRYSGQMNPGNFKFAVNTEGCWCQDFYTRNAQDAGMMVYNEGGSGEDLQWEMEAGGMYEIVVNVLTLKISIKEQDLPLFNNLWIVGDATESGWNVDTPAAFVQTGNPFVFTYEGVFTPGNFKIMAGSLGDWCGQWYRPLVDNEVLTATTVDQNSGCDVDNKWQVTAATAGRYKITLNIGTNVISIKPVEVYLIGDATPNGWSMGNLTPMTKNGSIYTWTGNLAAGEMKFTKFNTNWCEGTEIVPNAPNQSITNTSFHYRNNCEGDDNKWSVSAAQAGTYTITVNLDANTLTIQ